MAKPSVRPTGQRLPAVNLRRISRLNIFQAVRDFNDGVPHSFGESTDYDLILDGKRYPPKAILGLAGRYALGRMLVPDDFSGGEDSICFRVLREHGFVIGPKEHLTSVCEPTADLELLQRMTSSLAAKTWTNPPVGQVKPEQVMQEGHLAYKRDPEVRAYILRIAKGHCELCGQPAPFKDPAGAWFLEVHHVVQLAHGGQDTPANTVALCPNCHRRLHHSGDALEARRQVYTGVPRLNPMGPLA